MLQQLLHILLISVICIIWGLPIILSVQQKKNITPISTEEIILSFFTGLSLISLFAAWICLWLPLTWTILAIATLLPLILTIILFKKKGTQFPCFPTTSFFNTTNSILAVFAFLSIALLVILGSNSPVMIDTGLYHLQIIRWNHEYGTVPGLGNIYPRYGFYSNWLSLISLFSLPFKNVNFLYLNITLGIWFYLFLIQKLSFYLKQYYNSREHALMSWTYTLIIIIMFVEWGLFRVNSSSTSYDFIVTCITLTVLLYITEELIFTSSSTITRLIPLLIISVSAPFFKLSGATLIFIIFVYLVLTKKNKIIYFAFVCLLILFILPFLYRNYLLTGYPIYPYTFIIWGAPDWQVPLQMTNRINRFVSLINKYFNQHIPEADWVHPSSQWIKTWFTHIPLTDKVIIILAATGLPVFLLMFKKILQNKIIIIPIYISCCVALFIWFILSPDPRFAYGYLLFIATFPLSFLTVQFINHKSILFLLSILSIGILIYSISKFNANNILKPENITITEITSVRINDATYNIPEVSYEIGMRCYYSALPCIYELNPYLEQRSNNLKDGFRMKKNIDSMFIINYRY